jgi:hypothetical protein
MTVDNIIIFRELSPYSVGGDCLSSDGYHVIPTNIKVYFKFIIRICRKLKIYTKPFLKLFWNIDNSTLSNASLFIVFDSSIDYYLCDCLRHYFSNRRLIIYYWNSINSAKEKQIKYFKEKTKWDIFSFSQVDCEKYGLRFNKIFSAVPRKLLPQNNNKIIRDIFFIGTDKGRINQIIELKKLFDEFGFSNKILCVSKASSLSGAYTDPIPYNEVLADNMISRAILDINYDDEFGMTMRELEALFLHKKLITNNKKITERDFYNENNIFIIDYSRPNILGGLREFLEKPFMPINKTITESYSISAWINRFLTH